MTPGHNQTGCAEKRWRNDRVARGAFTPSAKHRAKIIIAYVAEYFLRGVPSWALRSVFRIAVHLLVDNRRKCTGFQATIHREAVS